MIAMSVEELIKEIVREELKKELGEIEERLRGQLEKELDEFRGQLSDITARTEKIEGEMGNKWNILVKLRRYTLDKLMSEYSKIEESMHPVKEEPAENAEI